MCFHHLIIHFKPDLHVFMFTVLLDLVLSL